MISSANSYGGAIPYIIKGMEAGTGLAELRLQLREMNIPLQYHKTLLRKASFQHCQSKALAFIKERFGEVAPSGLGIAKVLNDFFVYTNEAIQYVIYLCKRRGIYCLCSEEDYNSLTSKIAA